MRICAICQTDNPDEARFCHACGSPLATAPTTETRKLVSVVFCDLVDSTRMGSGLDAESLRTIIGRYFEVMRAVIERHGGTVEKFIGDAVVAVFGIPVVHEDDAIRAVRAAAEMRDALAPLNEEIEATWGVRLRTRTGVNSGEVLATDGAGGQSFMMGGPVVLAARLEQAAGTDQILLGEHTFNLVRDAVSTETVGPLDLKGIGDDIVAHRLLDVIPGAAGHARRPDSPFVDRDRESALLHQTFERTLAGRQCQLFTILGAAGVGKSRLVEEFLTVAAERALVLRGRCLPYGKGITFWPVVEIVREAAGLSVHDSPKEARHKIAAVVEGEHRGDRAAERVAHAIGIGDSAAGPDDTLWAIRTFLEALARRRPIAVVIDDLHWAEPTLLDLVDHVADWSKDVPIMLIALARPDLLEVRPTWGGGKLNAASVLLEPLTDEDSEALVGNLLGADVDSDARSRIIEAAGGNPLFVEEIVSMLVDEGLLVREDDLWIASDVLTTVAIPPTISALLTARLDRLPPDERTIVERAAVVGREFSIEALSTLVPEELAAGIDANVASLVRKELLRPVRSQDPEESAVYGYRHLLIRDAAYDALSKQLRAELHERFAGWLVDRAGNRFEEYEEILGYHLELAHRYLIELGPNDEHARALATQAGSRLAAAGRRALQRGDLRASANLLGRAAAILPEGAPERGLLLVDLSESFYYTSDLDLCIARLDELLVITRKTGDRSLETWAELRRANLAFLKDPRGTTIEDLRARALGAVETFEAFSDDGRLARALVILALVAWMTGDAAEMLRSAERALLFARRAGEGRIVPLAAMYVGRALVLGPTPCSVAMERISMLVAELADDRMAQATCRLELAFILGMLGRFDEAKEHAALARATFEDLGQRRWLTQAASTDGLIAWAEGDLEEAERRMRSLPAFFRSQQDVSNATMAASDLASVLCELGRYEEAADLADEIRANAGLYDLEPQVAWRCVRAHVLASQGAHGEAEELVRSALDLADSTDFLGLQAGVLVDVAMVLAQADRRADAETALRDALARYRRKQDVAWERLAAERMAATLS